MGNNLNVTCTKTTENYHCLKHDLNYILRKTGEAKQQHNNNNKGDR